ncbi:MAG TPA: DUF445 domain-containing protein [Spirochaetia bacterium]|nr:DUF445 domain-containing protein [Spirochaetia bacterium]
MTRRNRIGLISLVIAGAGFLLVTFQPWLPLEQIHLFGTLTLRGLLTAFFDASLVGALADWFAVSALFRNPLGVPLPHTNILAKNREAIAEAVPRFLGGFVREETIAGQLGSVDFAGKVEKLLSDPAARGDTNEFIRARLSSLLAPAAQAGGEPSAAFLATVREVVGFVGERLDPVRAAGGLLRWARAEGVDAVLIDRAAAALASGISRHLDYLVDEITPMVKQNAGWQGIFVGRGTIERLLRGAQEELERVRSDREHGLRQLLDREIASLDERFTLESHVADPIRGQLKDWFTRLVADPQTAVRAAKLAAFLVDRLHAVLEPGSRGFVEGAERLEDAFVSQLRVSPEFRAAFNRGVTGLISSLIVRSNLVEGVTGYLAAILKNTDEREFVDRVEAAVWNDLQYIRVNGAVVGGIVGLVLAAILAAK